MKEDQIFLSNGRVHIKEINQWGTLNSGRMVVYIASAKIPEGQGTISPSSFYVQLPDYSSHVFGFIYLVDEFS